jgi:hypothetical protein
MAISSKLKRTKNANQPDFFKELPAVQRKRYNALANVMDQPAQIEDAIFLHSVLCQAFLPYRNPGDKVREYEQRQGNAALLLEAGSIYNPKTNSFKRVGLPYGAKARLVMAYINTMAIKTQSAEIPIEESLTGFVRRLELSTDGRSIRAVKDQLTRLAQTTINVGYSISENEGLQGKSSIIDTMHLWFHDQDTKQAALWPALVKLSDPFFNDLLAHSVPMDERVIGALSNNAMAMDIYVWLVQRLHRVPENRPAAVSWKALSDQFGGRNYARMRKFRENFRKAMKVVLSYYETARIEENEQGLVLYNSPTPIGGRSIMLPSGR